MTTAPSTRALYLENGSEPIFGLLHSPAQAVEREIAVLICPPFGWEDVSSYRSRRDWAEQLAGAGYEALRIDLPGTGDSGGSPWDPDRLGAWSGAVHTAAAWLAGASPERSVAAIGIGFGGMIVCRAIGEGAPIDEMVLWGVSSRGSAFLRELRAFERMEAPRLVMEEETQPPAAERGPGAGGYALSAETTEALQELDLAALDFARGRLSRALLLERDGLRVDSRLRERLEQAGVAVDAQPGPGYGAMMAEPPAGRPPLAVFAQVQSWLEEERPRPTARPRAQPAVVGAHDSVELAAAGKRIRETPLYIEQPFGYLFGVLAEPVDGATTGLCAVMLNAGATRRTGPNRMWVEAARRWAARGVPTLRLDVEGIGDADGDADRLTELAELYVPALVDQTLAALDDLERRGLGHRFVCVGLCSGAYWSFHAALRDDRVVAALMLNPQALRWDASLEPIRNLRRALLDPVSWRRLRRRDVTRAQLVAILRQAPDALAGSIRRRLMQLRARRSDGDELDRSFDRLEEMDKYLLMAFSKGEPLHYEFEHEGRLERLRRLRNLELGELPGRDHTLRPPASQHAAHAALDRGLERVLERERRRGSSAPSSAVRQPSSAMRSPDGGPTGTPRVAVIIPCFNDGELAAEAVSSVEGAEDAEVVVVDDGSTDPHTLRALEELAGSGVRVLRQDNAGLSAARMAGVRATTAPYVYNLDADDLTAPEALRAMADRLDADPEAALCYGDYLEFGDSEVVRLVPPTVDPYRLAYTNEYPVTALFRREALEAVGGWRHLGAGYEDWRLWMTLAERHCKGVHAGAGIITFRRRLHGERMLGAAKADHRTLYRALRREHPGLFAQIAVHRRASDLSPLRKLLYPVVYGGRRRFRFERRIKAWLDRTGLWTLRG